RICALLQTAVNSARRMRLSDAEGAHVIRNAAREAKCRSIYRIEPVYRGLHVAPQLALVESEELPSPHHELPADHHAVERRAAFRKHYLQQRVPQRHVSNVTKIEKNNVGLVPRRKPADVGKSENTHASGRRHAHDLLCRKPL